MRKSKEAIRKERNAERVNKWQQANTKKVIIAFKNVDDAEALEWLQKQPNKSAYIKNLILSDKMSNENKK